MKKILIIFLAFLCVTSVHAQEGFSRDIKPSLFVPKGTWMGGATFSYTEMVGKNYKFLILDDVRGEGYTCSVSPYVGYFFTDNIAAGVRFKYGRTYGDIENINLNLGDDLDFGVNDYLYLDHQFTTSAFLRTYMGLGNSKIFGFFNELSLTYGYGQGKTVSGKGQDVTGTYQTSHSMQIGAAPGLSAFVMNNLAVEVSVNVMGVSFDWIEQTTNQVESGSFRTSSADFKINILSVNIGLCAYF